MSSRTERTRRVLRALAAISAALVLGSTAFLMLAWGPVGSHGSRASVWREPELLVLLAALPVTLATLPPVAERLAGRALRWIFLPSTLAALLLCAWLTYDALVRGFVDARVLALVLPTLPCALFVSWRLLLPPRKR